MSFPKFCITSCPNRKQHYKINSISHLNYGKKFHIPCGIKGSINHPDTLASKNNLTYEQIKTIYEPMGFKYFKLEGRTLPPIELLCNYVKFMVKPEYYWEVIGGITSMLNSDTNQY